MLNIFNTVVDFVPALLIATGTIVIAWMAILAIGSK